MTQIRLYLDDERIEPEGWLRVTTAENCIAILIRYAGQIWELSLDHDLDDHVETRRGYAEPAPMTGYDVACWLEEQASRGAWKYVPRVLSCHSANPVGRKRIEQALQKIAEMAAARNVRP